MDRVAEDIMDNKADAMADVEAVEDGAEDEDHLRRRRRQTTYLKSADRLPHSLVEEPHHYMPRTLSNVTIIGIIVFHVASTWKMDIHQQHAHMIGKNLGTKRAAIDRMYIST